MCNKTPTHSLGSPISANPFADFTYQVRSKVTLLGSVLPLTKSEQSTRHQDFPTRMASNADSNSSSNPSMLHGHAAYVAAAAKVW